ncbi:MAG: hypothetical protein OEZ14_16015 [Acidimicrobiia bacterium]|nr:hypothetical protein [Acidimicrobiia bacterium]
MGHPEERDHGFPERVPWSPQPPSPPYPPRDHQRYTAPPPPPKESEVDSFLIVCANVHDRQFRWPSWVRVGWWLLLPMALWCWASGMRAGAGRRLALGTIAVLTTIAMVSDRSAEPATVVAAGKTMSPADHDNGDAPNSTTRSTPATETIVESTASTATGSTGIARALAVASELDTTRSTASAEPPTTPAEPTTTAVPTTASTTATDASITSPPTTAASTISTTTAGVGCDPNYSGCVPIASDVDCAGGSGNGPAYVAGPVQVIGQDIYGLDADNDGIGCEKG